MKQKKSVWRNFAMVSQLGLSVIAPIIFCIMAGWYLDSRFGTELMGVFLLLGFGAGARNGYLLAKKLIWMEKQEDDEEHGTGR